MRPSTLLALIAAMMPSLAMAQTPPSDWRPEKPIELVVGAEAGGSNDRAARLIQRVTQAQRLIPQPMTVVNKPGAGQTLAQAYVNTHRSDPHYLLLVSSSWLTTAIQNGTASYRELTPIAKLFNDSLVLFVKADSPLQTVQDVVASLKKDPSLTFAFSTSAGNSSHLALAELARLSGADPIKLRIAVNSSGSITATQVAGGHVAVGISSAGSALPLVDAGQIKLIGAATKTRLPGRLAPLPTLSEQGVNVVASSWYMILGPQGLTSAQTLFWEQVIKTALETSDAKAAVDQDMATLEFIGTRDLPSYLGGETARLERALTDIGMIKK